MDPVNRLIQAGIRSDCATETVLQFEARGDDAGLECYILEEEKKAEIRKGFKI